MKRKIIYIILVILFAIVVSILTNGCTVNSKEKATSGLQPQGTQQDTQQTNSQNQNKEITGSKTTPTVSTTSTALTTNGATAQSESQKKYVTITISCATIFDNLEAFDKAKIEILPKDGLIVPTAKVEITEGETVFDVLLKVTKGNKIHMEYVSTPLYKSNYIEGIGNIYEIDAGPLSGWMYKVNNQFPNYGCGMYVLKDGDNIEWVYTCDLGRDVGGDWNEQNK